MEKIYVTSGPAPTPGQAVCIQTEAQPKVEYVNTTTTTTTTKQSPPPPTPSTTIVVVRPYLGGNVIYLAFWLFVYGGMDLAQGLDANLFTLSFLNQFHYSWFIGFIIGAIIASVGVSYLPKFAFYILSCILEMIDGILFVSTTEYNCILIARYMGGAGIGLLTVVYLIHSSEVSHINNRGALTGIEQCGIALGIAVEVIYCVVWRETVDTSVYIVHGALGIAFAFVSFISILNLIKIDSPIFHLRHNQEAKALECQRIISLTNQACVRALNEAKLYVAEGESESIGEQIGGSVMPFIKLLLQRCLVAFTVSLPLILSIEISSIIAMRSYLWPFILWAVLRVLGTFISLSAVDKLGRKALSLVGLFCMAALMLAMAGIYATNNNFTTYYYMVQVSNLGMAFQFFAGIYICTTSTYLSESFPMKVKPFFIALVVCIEQVIHIIVIVCLWKRPQFFFQYFLAVGIIMFLGCIALAAIMPETRQTTLRQAGQRFRKMFYTKMY